MGPIGFPELVFILILAILIFGPKRLPEIGRTLGKGMTEFRKASNDLKRTLNTELALDEEPAPPALRPYRAEPPAQTAPRMPAHDPQTEGFVFDSVPDAPTDDSVAPGQASDPVSSEPLEPR